MKRQHEETDQELANFGGEKSKHKKVRKGSRVEDTSENDVQNSSVVKDKFKTFKKKGDSGKTNRSVTQFSASDKGRSSDKSKKITKSFEKKGQKGTFAAKKKVNKDSGDVDKKELRKKQKLLKKSRREKDRGYAIPDGAKQIFEELRCKKCPPEKQKELSVDLFKFLSGKIKTAVRSHDLARMIQWLVKVGPPDIKEKVIEEVIGDTVSLSTCKYSNHIILKILQDCDKRTRKKIFGYFIGNVARLLGNKFSSPVIEEYYSKFAKSKEKAFLRQELYSDLFRSGQNPSLTSLSDALSQNPTLSSAILKSTKTILSKLIEKNKFVSSIVTDVLYDYLQHCEEQDKLDLFESLKANIQALLKSKSGSKVLMLLLWESAAKVKKSIVKDLKPHILTIAKSEGNIVLRSLFDAVDDTVLVKKAILPTILDNVEELVKDTHGKKVILYLVAHRDSLFFHPQEVEELKKADESKSVKKDMTVKEKELLESCIDALLVKIKENPEFWFSEASISVVTRAILEKGSGAVLMETYQAIADFVENNIQEDKFKVIEDSGLHMVLKKLIKKEESDSVETSFSEYLAKCLTVESVVKLLNMNRGCFILVFLIETNNDRVRKRLKKIFKACELLKMLENKDFLGSKILKKCVTENNLLS